MIALLMECKSSVGYRVKKSSFHVDKKMFHEKLSETISNNFTQKEVEVVLDEVDKVIEDFEMKEFVMILIDKKMKSFGL